MQLTLVVGKAVDDRVRIEQDSNQCVHYDVLQTFVVTFEVGLVADEGEQLFEVVIGLSSLLFHALDEQTVDETDDEVKVTGLVQVDRSEHAVEHYEAGVSLDVGQRLSQ